LRDPYPVQYAYWLKSLLQGKWGYSPTLKDDVLPALVHRTPATAELTILSVLFFIPVGLVSGVLAGWKQNRRFDNAFRFMAFLATSFPPFILALLLISIFYAKLHWFPPGRIDQMYDFQISGPLFHPFTGMYTIDSLLNGRFDIFVNALRHLALPVFTLSLFHWATLGRISRSTIIAERHKDYIVAAQSRGLTESRVLWRHVFWNTLAPSFTSMALSVASLITGVFVVEIIYTIRGVSDIIVKSMQMLPDAPAALGFALYSVLIVFLIMFVLDILQAIFDPRLREELIK
jgi:peptide/nickel transport system permease protein